MALDVTAKDLLLVLAGAVVGAIISLVAAIYIQDPWKTISDRHRRQRRVRRVTSAWIDSEGPILIGGNLTNVFLVEGDGRAVLEPQHITVNVRTRRADLPDVIADARAKVVRELAASSRQQGSTVSFWNSQNMVALMTYKVSRTPLREDPTLRLDTCLTDYATFVATVLSLDKELPQAGAEAEGASSTLRRMYLPTESAISESLRHPRPFLANGVGIMLVAFTDDEKVLLCHRRPDSRARAGECDVSVVEGLDATFDTLNGRLDVHSAAIRGCREELGIDVPRDAVSVLAFGVDMTYYQWNFMGVVDTRHTSNEVLEFHAAHAKDRWEGKLEPVNLDPIDIFERLRRNKIWDLGLVTTYLALCKKRDVAEVRRAAYKTFRVPQHAPWRR